MARTKKQIEAYLNGLVGQSVNDKAGIYRGQCVSLIKALLEYVGAPDPYKARGDAKDYADTLLRENIAEKGKGFLTIVVNRDMGRLFVDGRWQTFGHIWVDVKDKANYEQNGAQALRTTKNTRPISQGQQFVNLDKWIKEEDMVSQIIADCLSRFYRGYDCTAAESKAWVGKKTPEQTRDAIRASAGYKKAVETFSSGKATSSVLLTHTPEGLRKVYKAPATPPSAVNRESVLKYIQDNLK